MISVFVDLSERAIERKKNEEEDEKKEKYWKNQKLRLGNFNLRIG